MDKEYFISCITKNCSDVVFLYKDKKCGICSTVKDSVFSFHAWCGNEIKEYNESNIETIMNDPFFDGKSINDLLTVVKFDFL